MLFLTRRAKAARKRGGKRRCFEQLASRAMLATAPPPGGGDGWITPTEVTGSDPPMDLAQDAAGNTYVTGHYSGTMTIGATTLMSNGPSEDLFFAKLSPSGDVLWAKSFGGTGQEFGRGIDVASDGAIHFAGYFNGTVTLPTTTGPISLTSAGEDDALVLKLNAAGDIVWARSAGGAGDDSGRAIATASDGSIYVAGEFRQTASFGSITLSTSGSDQEFLAKLSDTGEFLWVNPLATPGTANDVLVGATGDVFVAGTSTARFDPAGNLIWRRDGNESVGAIYQDSSTGQSYVYTAELYTDNGGGKVQKLDAITGETVWEKTIISPQEGHIMALAADPAGNVYLTGGWGSDGGVTDFDPGPGEFYLASTSFFDIFLTKLDSAGEFVSARRMGGTGPSDRAHDVLIDAAGSVFLCGMWGGNAEFDLGNSTVTRSSSRSEGQGFILKMTQGRGALSGLLFNDLNGDGVRDNNELPMPAGTQVYLDLNQSGAFDEGEPSALSNAHGSYLIPNVTPGSYAIRQVLAAGWSETSAPASHTVLIGNDGFVGGQDFAASAPTQTKVYASTDVPKRSPSRSWQTTQSKLTIRALFVEV